MVNEPKIEYRRGLGLPSILTIILLLLKAFKVISIGWIWVFAPLWISVGIWLAIILFLLAMAVIAAIVGSF